MLPFRRGQSRVAVQQTRNAVSALGQIESFATYVGTWLAGIAIGVVLILLIPVAGIFNSEAMQPAAQATSDRNGTALIGNQPIAQRENIAKQGYQVFQTNCQVCHRLGGYGISGQGPRLVYSGHGDDSSFIHSIVRWGYSPMPAFPSESLTDDQLYKIVVYLQYAHENRATKPDWVVDPNEK